ncbi:hypothetical protein PENSOL_c124G10119 [Penicillium solitum]|uniref:Uncharacterized protein n=1 Tax=Penicillium solitum TaxID=60172 RepID=A0A1V6Q6C3_9EURO|nr:uncharacterized protein PENSOL_c124G10119 [Penicillium solitum]OQD84462.1 hypothetical protein PENSOL_c124G10119 [Penicillium solitum]
MASSAQSLRSETILRVSFAMVSWFSLLCSASSAAPAVPNAEEQLERIGIGFMELDYDQIMSNPQATRYVVNFMHRTGLLQQFQHVGIGEENDDDEPAGLAAMELGVEDDGY